MRCKDFDTHIDEMLSGVLQPDAGEHMRQCERCTSYYRARAAVQNGLRGLAAASASPSRATDRAVMDSFRRLQERRAAAAAQPSAPRPAARLFSFPSRGAAARGTRHNWTGIAVAAMLLAMIGSGMRLWTGVSTVSSPEVTPTPAVASSASPAAPVEQAAPVATVQAKSSRTVAAVRGSLRAAKAGRITHAAADRGQLIEAKTKVAGPELQKALDSAAAQETEGSVMQLAGTSGNAGVGQASATWPGYNNLMYCDPVVCSGPMQVIHIRVPAEQVDPAAAKQTGKGRKSFVNADVVVGPDGVARAIRVAN